MDAKDRRDIVGSNAPRPAGQLGVCVFDRNTTTSEITLRAGSMLATSILFDAHAKLIQDAPFIRAIAGRVLRRIRFYRIEKSISAMRQAGTKESTTGITTSGSSTDFGGSVTISASSASIVVNDTSMGLAATTFANREVIVRT